ncbi:MAG TPA: decarboxylating NADP(+)-dependent phosphogluconate dehydrogenase [Phycisphaerae bacterium]|nr:decarboxylating NADP(+)-dependent phosphogluconate dehydrogenase [Phycisphaerae bacterium]
MAGDSARRQTVGLIGCGVMGQNLALNLERNGYSVAVYDADAQKSAHYLATRAAGKNIIGVKSLSELVASLETPRRILMMVPAGQAVDQCIEQLLPHLHPGDTLIDGGNSHYADTNRRTKHVEHKGLRYVGAGVSGGAEGALHGPSIMPGGSPTAWESVKPMFRAIAAKADDGAPCCDWIGENGAGHFVKMVHNGIEYGNMQLICEAYHLMRDGLGLSLDGMRDVFDDWNRGELASYLIEITRNILGYRNEDGEAVIDKILDTAGQKGTGTWTVATALDLGQPFNLTAEAVFARGLSTLKDERVSAANVLTGPPARFEGGQAAFLDDLRQALYAAKIISHAQGFQLMRAAAKSEGWNLNYAAIASLWRAGCIIRSALLGGIKEAFTKNPNLVNLLLDPFFTEAVSRAQPAWRRVVATAVSLGVPVSAMGSALAYFDGYRNPRLPANLLQAQRDYFGAHTYERVDKARGQFFHTDWTGRSD